MAKIQTKTNRKPVPKEHNIHKIVATVAAVFTIITTIGIYLYTSFYKIPNLQVRLRLRYEGCFLTIINKGKETSKDNYIRIVFWRDGAPVPDYEGYEQIRDLPPKSDYSFRINFWEEAIGHGHNENRNLHVFGYIVASCSNMKKPNAWAFHICFVGYSDENSSCHFNTDGEGNVPLAEFAYPEEAPHCGQAINFPEKYSE